jgi:hypothetical protein
VQFSQNISPKAHPILRKSQDRISPKSTLKRVPSIRDMENRTEFSKMSVPMNNHKLNFQEMVMGFGNSGNIVSLRVI